MNPRTILALSVGGVAAVVALGFGVLKQMGVKSYGHPAGRVVRAGSDLCVLIQTRDPYMPSLKGRSESDMSYSYALWVIPEACDGDVRTIGLARGVPSGSRTHNIGAQQFGGGVLWLAIEELQGVELATGKKTAAAAPASLVNAPISQLMGSNEHPLEQYRAKAVTLPSGEWLFLAGDDEAKADLKPGARLYDNPGAVGTYKARGLHRVAVQPGPIPRVAGASRLGDRVFRNGAFMRSAKGGGVVRFTNPDGFLIVHEDGDPVHPTLCLSRLNANGTINWSADTGIGRLTQVLPHERLPAFVGELPQQLTEPTLAVIDLNTGTARTKSLKGPLN